MLLRAALIVAMAAPLAALPPPHGQDLDTPIGPGAQLTYLDLLRLVCSDLQLDKR